ncbi:MAG: endonuclease III [Rhodospirillales bacterium]|nr:endonuclease III [Rhodospirillales bacterium]
MNKAKIHHFYAKLKQQNPEPKGELHYVNDYTLLVAVVLSAQATDVGVNKATKPLFKKIKTPKKMFELGEAKLKNYIKSIGLYNSKAKNVIKLSHMLLDEYGGKIPEDRDELQKLPGVGRKTANLVLIVALRSQENICVDTHVHRISNRLGWVETQTPAETEEALYQVAARRWWPLLNLYLVTWGQNVCKPVYPVCGRCAISTLCPQIGVVKVGK